MPLFKVRLLHCWAKDSTRVPWVSYFRVQGFEGRGGVEFPAGLLPNLLWDESWGRCASSTPEAPSWIQQKQEGFVCVGSGQGAKTSKNLAAVLSSLNGSFKDHHVSCFHQRYSWGRGHLPWRGPPCTFAWTLGVFEPHLQHTKAITQFLFPQIASRRWPPDSTERTGKVASS